MKKSVPENPLDSLTTLRNDIDAVDREIVELLVKRQEVVDKVISLKKKHNISVYDPIREEDIISDRRRQAKERGLEPGYIEKLFRTILSSSRLV